ncbi:MAG: hypothetical protein VXX50_00460 [Candidatus Thermoplasmatota archaeon]|nr:hypothetical protein [Candidatus Thermoplasmatota archaeon]
MSDDARTGPDRREAALRRELWRTRNSASFRLGNHLIEAARKPWRILALPISLPLVTWQIGMELLGRRPRPMSDSMIQLKGGPERSIVLFPTNGVGFGHFTRMYGLARRLRRLDPDLEIIFFTTQPTLHLPYLDGFPTYHLAGPKKFKGMESEAWNAMVQEMLTLVLETHRPQTFVFDGAFPYRGMLDALDTIAVPQKVWLRRAMFRKGSSIPVDSIGKFDLIVHPEDAVPLPPSEIDHGVEVLTVPPMTLIDSDEMWSREDARNRLGVPQNARVAYVQLGAGRINEIDSDVRQVTDALLAYEDIHVVLGESLLGDRLRINLERVHLIRDYPNALFFNAFDVSVQAGGYNSFHEMRKLGIPTLFLPNMNTGMDDQLARCKVAEDEDWGIVQQSNQQLSTSIDELLKMKSKESINSPNGHTGLSIHILEGM